MVTLNWNWVVNITGICNLDPSTQIKLKNMIRDFANENGVTFLISSHDLAHTTEVCNRIVVVNKGEVVRDIQTTPETLQDLEKYFTDQVKPVSNVVSVE